MGSVIRYMFAAAVLAVLAAACTDAGITTTPTDSICSTEPESEACSQIEIPSGEGSVWVPKSLVQAMEDRLAERLADELQPGYPDVLYSGTSRSLTLGSLSMIVRSSQVDRHCEDCTTLTKKITLHTYVTNNSNEALDVSDLVRVKFRGTFGGRNNNEWTAGTYYVDDLPAGITRSHRWTVEAPLAASNFRAIISTCEPSAYSFRCDADHVPATPASYVVPLRPAP